MSAVCNVWNLGTWFNNYLSIKTAINKTCQSGLYHLHNMGRIKRFLSSEDGKSIVQAIVMSRIDYCNSLLYGVAATNLSKLQRVQNAAVRLVCSLWRHEHVTSSLYVFTGCWLSLESISRLLCSVSSAFMDTPPIIKPAHKNLGFWSSGWTGSYILRYFFQ